MKNPPVSLRGIGQAIDRHIAEDSIALGRLNRTMYGDAATQEIGMKAKVDEMHDILVQLKGVLKFFGFVATLGAAVAAIKVFVLK